MGLSRTVSETDSDFSRKSKIFPTHVYLTPPMKDFPLNMGISAKGQKLEWCCYQMVEKVLRQV